MPYSENIASKDHWIEDQIEAQLKTTSSELEGLQDIVLEGDVLKAEVKNGQNIEMKDITLEHAVNILTFVAGKSWEEIYGSNSAGVVFALQIVLNYIKSVNQDYSELPDIEITGLYNEDMKTAVRKFQELAQFSEEDQDTKAGKQTIGKILKLVDNNGVNENLATKEEQLLVEKKVEIDKILYEGDVNWKEREEEYGTLLDYEKYKVGSLQLSIDPRNDLEFASKAEKIILFMHKVFEAGAEVPKSIMVDGEIHQQLADGTIVALIVSEVSINLTEGEELIVFCNNPDEWPKIIETTEEQEEIIYEEETYSTTYEDDDGSTVITEYTDENKDTPVNKTVTETDGTVTVYEDLDTSNDKREKKTVTETDGTITSYERSTNENKDTLLNKTVTETDGTITTYKRNTNENVFVIIEEEDDIVCLKEDINAMSNFSLINYIEHTVAGVELVFDEDDEKVFLGNALYLLSLLKQAEDIGGGFTYKYKPETGTINQFDTQEEKTNRHILLSEAGLARDTDAAELTTFLNKNYGKTIEDTEEEETEDNFTVAGITIQNSSKIDFLEKTLILLGALKGAEQDGHCIYRYNASSKSIEQFAEDKITKTQRSISIDETGLTAETSAELVDYLNTEAGWDPDDNLEIAETQQKRYEAYVQEQIDKSYGGYVIISKIPKNIDLSFLNDLEISKIDFDKFDRSEGDSSILPNQENIPLFLDQVNQEKITHLFLNSINYDYSKFYNLEELSLQDYSGNTLPNLPDNLNTLHLYQTTITQITQLPLQLENLDVGGATQLKSITGTYSSLQELDISRIETLVDISQLRVDNLQTLRIGENPWLTTLNSLPTSITTLELDYCENLTDLGLLDKVRTGCFNNLTTIYLTGSKIYPNPNVIDEKSELVYALKTSYGDDLEIILEKFMGGEHLASKGGTESFVDEDMFGHLTQDLSNYQQQLLSNTSDETKEQQETVRVILLTYAQAHDKLSQPLSSDELAGKVIYKISDRTRPTYSLPEIYQDKDNIIIHGSFGNDAGGLAALAQNADFGVFISREHPRTFVTDLEQLGGAGSMRYMINNNPLSNLSSLAVEFSAPGNPKYSKRIARKKDGKFVYKDGKKIYDTVFTDTLPPSPDQIEQFRHTKRWIDQQLGKKLTITTSYQGVAGEDRKFIHTDTEHRDRNSILKALGVRLQLERGGDISKQDHQTYLSIIQDMYTAGAISMTRKNEYTRYINEL